MKAFTILLVMGSIFATSSAGRVSSFEMVGFASRRLLDFTNVTLPPLPYDYDALEPVISTDIMQLHHDKHHQAYVNGFNAAVAQLQAAQDASDVATIVRLTTGINFNGGGHLNHALFWESLTPVDSYEAPSGALGEAINSTWGSFKAFQDAVTAAAAGLQGSGWVWLGLDPETGTLSIQTTANQDTLQSKYGLTPLLGVDLWEHSYYLQYKNVRPDYVTAIWQVINWPEVGNRYDSVAA